jgi:hypothetical protein
MFDSFKLKLNAYFMVDYCIVYEILCKYTKLMIILLCLIPLHTNLKLVDDYLLLFAKEINKKIVNKNENETFNSLEKREFNDSNIPNKSISPNIKGEEAKEAIEDGDLSKQPSPKEVVKSEKSEEDLPIEDGFKLIKEELRRTALLFYTVVKKAITNLSIDDFEGIDFKEVDSHIAHDLKITPTAHKNLVRKQRKINKKNHKLAKPDNDHNDEGDNNNS